MGDSKSHARGNDERICTSLCTTNEGDSIPVVEGEKNEGGPQAA
jgi:hypothetical protein